MRKLAVQASDKQHLASGVSGDTGEMPATQAAAFRFGRDDIE